MKPDLQTSFNKLREIRDCWKALNRPNEEISGFDFDDVSMAINETQALELLRGKQLEEYAESLIERVTPPPIDHEEPPYSALVVHFHLSAAEKALKTFLPRAPDTITLDANEHAHEIQQLREYIEEMNQTIPLLEQQASEMKKQVTEVKDIVSADQKASQGINGIQLGLFGVTASVGNIKSALSSASRSLSFPSDPGVISKVESKIKSVLDWAQNAYRRVLGANPTKESVTLAVTINRLGRKAAQALTVAKQIIISNLRRRNEVSTKKIMGSFSVRDYAVEFEIGGKDLEYIDRLLESSEEAGFDHKTFFERHINTETSSGYPRDVLQTVIFNSFFLKREMSRIEPKFFPRNTEYNKRACQNILKSVMVLRKRVDDENYIGPITPLEALHHLGYLIPERDRTGP